MTKETTRTRMRRAHGSRCVSLSRAGDKLGGSVLVFSMAGLVWWVGVRVSSK